VKQWLVDNVHQQGNLVDPPVLIQQITGEPLNPQAYLAYLNEKCSWVYGY